MKNTKWLLLALMTLVFSWTGWVHAKPADQSYEQLKNQYYQDHPEKGTHASTGSRSHPEILEPQGFLQAANHGDREVTREQCVTCHQSLTPGAYHAWQDSAHAKLDKIRDMSNAQDARYYKKEKLAEVEKNLAKTGPPGRGAQLKEVGCIDCHGPVGAKSIHHDKDLVMPDRAKCGTCHVGEFAEAESEKEQEWPQKQWGKGHPSHAVDWQANVELAAWAAMPGTRNRAGLRHVSLPAEQV